MSTSEVTANGRAASRANPWVALFLAWIVPGAGHFYLGRFRRGGLFLALVISALLIGCSLDGNLYNALDGSPLQKAATLAAMGLGAPYFVALHVFGYAGAIKSAGYEYGTAFILSGGLMNVLLIFDAWDIGRGTKE